MHTPNNVMPTGIFFLNNTTGFVSGEKLFRKTTDGGQTWLEIMGTPSENISDVCFKMPMKDMLLLIVENI